MIKSLILPTLKLPRYLMLIILSGVAVEFINTLFVVFFVASGLGLLATTVFYLVKALKKPGKSG